MQVFDATGYRGQRLRLSAHVKSENVKEWAGLWMRIDRDKKAVAFDNMQNRPIRGSQPWTQHAIVLDVDAQANIVAFGILLAGTGAVWIDDVAFDIVGADVPVTKCGEGSKQSAQPRLRERAGKVVAGEELELTALLADWRSGNEEAGKQLMAVTYRASPPSGGALFASRTTRPHASGDRAGERIGT